MLTPSCFMVRMAPTICSTIFWRQGPADGSSSSTSDGLPHQSPRDGQHLLLAAAHAPARAIAHFGEVGKQREQFFARPVRRVRPRRLTADFEVFVDGQIRKNAALFRYIAEPAAHDGVGRLVRNIPALEHDAAAALRDQADDGAEGGGFAGAVAPEQRDHLAVADLERDVEQDVRRAVMAVEIRAR